MIQADYHLHSAFSDDSLEPMENQVKRAIELGLTEICFTEHVDYGVKRDWDDPRGVEWGAADPNTTSGDGLKLPISNCDYPRYFSRLEEMRQRYGSRITIRSGLEFGVQSITIPPFEQLFARYQDQLDFVLLSMHQVDNRQLWNQEFQTGLSRKEYNDRYYQEIYKVQQRFSHYNVLAHLDLIDRYDPNGHYPYEDERERIDEILKLAIAQGKGLELNTSSWHYGLPDTQPARAILTRYRQLGGRILTVGSDAHSTAWVASHFREAGDILKNELGFTEYCTFVHGEPQFHPL